MIIFDVFKLMCFVSLNKQRDGDRLDRCVAPPERIDTAEVIDVVDEVLVDGRYPKRHVRDFEVVEVDFSTRPLRVERRLQCAVPGGQIAIDRRPQALRTPVAP